jgi:hypothetical protein
VSLYFLLAALQRKRDNGLPTYVKPFTAADRLNRRVNRRHKRERRLAQLCKIIPGAEYSKRYTK